MPAAGLPQLRPPPAPRPAPPLRSSLHPARPLWPGAGGPPRGAGHRLPSGPPAPQLGLPWAAGYWGPCMCPHYLPTTLRLCPFCSRLCPSTLPQHAATSGCHRPAPTVTSPAPRWDKQGCPLQGRTLQGPAHCLAHSRPTFARHLLGLGSWGWREGCPCTDPKDA